MALFDKILEKIFYNSCLKYRRIARHMIMMMINYIINLHFSLTNFTVHPDTLIVSKATRSRCMRAPNKTPALAQEWAVWSRTTSDLRLEAEPPVSGTACFSLYLLSSINFTKAPKVPYIKTLLDDIEQATTVSTAAVPQQLALTNNANTYELNGRRWNKDWFTSKDDQTQHQRVGF